MMVMEIGCCGHRGQTVNRSSRKFDTACNHDNLLPGTELNSGHPGKKSDSLRFRAGIAQTV